MPSFDNIVIVGTGFMGNSIATAISQKGDSGPSADANLGDSTSRSRSEDFASTQVWGVDGHDEFRRAAESSGGFTRIFSTLDELRSNLSAPDLVVVCTPVERVADQISALRAHYPQATLTDIGSAKEKIVTACTDLFLRSEGQVAVGDDGIRNELIGRDRYVGGHPIAGGDATGPVTPPDSIFTHRLFVSTPTPYTDPNCLRHVESFWTSLDCRPVRLDAREHDEILAMTSHLPHVLASALSSVLSAGEVDFCGTGWRDTTRVARSNPLLWKEILVHNREAVLAAVRRFDQQWQSLTSAINAGEWDTVVSILEEGKNNRNALGN